MSTSIRGFWQESCRWALLVLLATLPFPTPPPADVAVGGIIRWPVTQVTTGRKMVIAGNVITLWGITVPESGQRCSSADRVEYDCGEHVRFALQLLTAGTAITCLTKDMDRQRTIWAQCEREGADLGSLLVVTGRAVIQSATGDVPDIAGHAVAIEALYGRAVARRNAARLPSRPGPWRITFDTNPDTCNLRCVMCEEHSPHSGRMADRRAKNQEPRIMPIDLIRRVVAEAAGNGLREIIPSTMGEPLLYEHFDEILDLCRQYGVKLNLTTNGTFPRRGARDWAGRIVPLASDVKISWNGATRDTQERIMLGARWDKVLDNVRTFIDVRDAHAASGGNRCRVTFQLTFLRDNVDELADIVRLAIRLGVDRVKGHHLWAHFIEIEDQSMRRSAPAIQRWNAAVREAQAAVTEARLPNGETILLENIFPLDETPGAETASGGPCPFLGQEAWVSAAGRFDPCCAPDARRRTLGEFGNLHETGLTGIWRSRAYRSLTMNYRNHALCGSCTMRKPAEVA